MINKVLLGAIGAAMIIGAAPAVAGEWRYDGRNCRDFYQNPDGRWNDRRADGFDHLYNNGRDRADRRDRADHQRDWRRGDGGEAITVCPTSAFYYMPSRSELNRGRYDKIERRGDGYSKRRGKTRPPFQYDRDKRMDYLTIDGERIYSRSNSQNDGWNRG